MHVKISSYLQTCDTDVAKTSNQCLAIPNPADPQKWTRQHVEQWLDWATQEFGLNPINVSKFPFTGVQLCHLSKEEFVERSPPYTGDVLYSHLTLLRARSGESVVYRC